MKKRINGVVILFLVMTAISCNSHFRFFVDPLPDTQIVIRPPVPGVGYIWIEGEWFWNGRTYKWRDGYWAKPAHGYNWKPGHWQKTGKGWYWVPGHWKR